MPGCTLDSFLKSGDNLKTAAKIVNFIATNYAAQTGKLCSEKIVQVTMAIAKALELPVAENWSYWPITWGLGIYTCFNGFPYYITSKKMQELGSYRVIRDSYNIIQPEPLKDWNTLLDETQKSILMALIKAINDDNIRMIAKHKLYVALKERINNLLEQFPGLLSDRLVNELLSRVNPIYHIPSLMRMENCNLLIDRTLKESKIRRLILDEDIKNNSQHLAKFLNKSILHSLATELRSGIEKILVYTAIWQDPSQDFVHALKARINYIDFKKPSEDFIGYLNQTLLILALRRVAVNYVRSLITKFVHPPKYYEDCYNRLLTVCSYKGIYIIDLYEHYYGGL